MAVKFHIYLLTFHAQHKQLPIRAIITDLVFHFLEKNYISEHLLLVMPTACSVISCSNSRCKVKKLGLDVVFHKFPKDAVLRSLWKKFCNRGEGWESTNFSIICSSHFQPQDYQLHNAPMMKTTALRKLKCEGKYFSSFH